MICPNCNRRITMKANRRKIREYIFINNVIKITKFVSEGNDACTIMLANQEHDKGQSTRY